ncbi:MAG: STAS domain-containing protein [Crocinitomicaceae bacterium]|nr:STAS domain-containing protein [Crocinitomicaceae bacterium]
MKNFSSEHKGNVAVVYSQVDKLDSTNAPELKSLFIHLNKSANNLIVLDMSQTKYCDSSGLSAILIANRLCKDTSGSFHLAGLQPDVLKLIQIAQLDKVLNLSENLDSALASLK